MMTANVRHRSVASSLKIRPSHRQRIRPIGVDSTTHSVAKDKRRLMRKHNHHWLSYFSTKREFYQWTAQTKKIVVEMDLKMTKRLLQVESILLMISHPVSHPFLSRVIKYICIYICSYKEIHRSLSQGLYLNYHVCSSQCSISKS